MTIVYHTTFPAINSKIIVKGANGKFKDEVAGIVISTGYDPRYEKENDPNFTEENRRPWAMVEIIEGPHKGHRGQVTLKTETTVWLS
jgi:hypothetical protein